MLRHARFVLKFAFTFSAAERFSPKSSGLWNRLQQCISSTGTSQSVCHSCPFELLPAVFDCKAGVGYC